MDHTQVCTWQQTPRGRLGTLKKLRLPGLSVQSFASGSTFDLIQTDDGRLWRRTLVEPIRELSLTCKVVEIASNETVALLLSVTGLVFGLGEDTGHTGVFGHLISAETPLLLEGFDGHTIASVSLGSTHAAAVNYKGQLLTWGTGKHGQLGRTECLAYVPQVVGSASIFTVTAVTCTATSTCICTGGGHLYLFGSAAHIPGESWEIRPHSLLPLEEHFVTTVASSANLVAALSDQGTVFVIDECLGVVELPRSVILKSVGVCGKCVYALTQSGDLVTWNELTTVWDILARDLHTAYFPRSMTIPALICAENEHLQMVRTAGNRPTVRKTTVDRLNAILVQSQARQSLKSWKQFKRKNSRLYKLLATSLALFLKRGVNTQTRLTFTLLQNFASSLETQNLQTKRTHLHGCALKTASSLAKLYHVRRYRGLHQAFLRIKVFSKVASDALVFKRRRELQFISKLQCSTDQENSLNYLRTEPEDEGLIPIEVPAKDTVPKLALQLLNVSRITRPSSTSRRAGPCTSKRAAQDTALQRRKEYSAALKERLRTKRRSKHSFSEILQKPPKCIHISLQPSMGPNDMEGRILLGVAAVTRIVHRRLSNFKGEALRALRMLCEEQGIRSQAKLGTHKVVVACQRVALKRGWLGIVKASERKILLSLMH